MQENFQEFLDKVKQLLHVKGFITEELAKAEGWLEEHETAFKHSLMGFFYGLTGHQANMPAGEEHVPQVMAEDPHWQTIIGDDSGTVVTAKVIPADVPADPAPVVPELGAVPPTPVQVDTPPVAAPAPAPEVITPPAESTLPPSETVDTPMVVPPAPENVTAPEPVVETPAATAPVVDTPPVVADSGPGPAA